MTFVKFLVIFCLNQKNFGKNLMQFPDIIMGWKTDLVCCEVNMLKLNTLFFYNRYTK